METTELTEKKAARTISEDFVEFSPAPIKTAKTHAMHPRRESTHNKRTPIKNPMRTPMNNPTHTMAPGKQKINPTTEHSERQSAQQLANQAVTNEDETTFPVLYRETVDEIKQTIVGMDEAIEEIFIAFLSGGHVLLEGLPGLAKTMLIKTFAEISALRFSRIQFTPDLLPGDILGTQIYDQRTGKFMIRKGPLFANIILADEINRAPSKVQSALLEAMQEKQITIADKSYELKAPYLVLATQNPIEHEGTYPLPEAQIDRFMMKIAVRYPEKQDEVTIIKQHTGMDPTPPRKVLSANKLKKLQKDAEDVYIDDRLIRYIVELASATRHGEDYGLSPGWIKVGASPRASIDLARAAKAVAFIHNESYVKTDDIKRVAAPVMRHRIITSYEAEAENITTDAIINEILSRVKVP